MLTAQNLEVDFSGKVILKGVSFKLEKEKALLLGPNGSGKTTLLRTILGLYPYRGSLKVDGQEVKSLKSHVGVATNLPPVYSLALTIKDLAYILEEIIGLDPKLFHSLLREMALEDVFTQPLYTLSSGQSVLVRNAFAVSSKPHILLLDEPFENVDPRKRLALVNWFKNGAEEAVLVTHDLSIAKKFEGWKVFFISEGLIYGPVMLEEFLEASIVEEERDGALMTVIVGGKKLSIIKSSSEGIKLDSIDSLNRLYEVV